MYPIVIVLCKPVCHQHTYDDCKALNKYDRTGKARQLFEKVRKVKKTPFTAKQACINDAQGNIITEQEPALDRLREYNEQLFAKPLN